jgi:hypothetical protein
MAASYTSEWPILPGTEPRPVTPIQWPSPPRVQPYATLQLSVRFHFPFHPTKSEAIGGA